MKKLLTILISIGALFGLLIPVVGVAYNFNQQDQQLLEAVYTKLHIIQQESPDKTKTIHTALQDIRNQYTGRSHAILIAIIDRLELNDATLRNYDGKLTMEQLTTFKQLPGVGDINS